MGTKSKEYRLFTIWISFTAGLSIFVFTLVMGLCLAAGQNFNSDKLKELLKTDIKDTKVFQNSISNLFDILCWSSCENLPTIPRLDDEGENLLYYSYNSEDDKLFTNTDQYESIWNNGNISLPEGYDYYLSFDGASFAGANDGEAFDVYEEGNEYWIKHHYGKDRNLRYGYYTVSTEHFKMFLVVKEKIVRNPNGDSTLYQLQRTHRLSQLVLAGIVIGFLLGIASLVFSAFNFKTKFPFERKIANFLNRVGFELKCLVTLLLLLFPIEAYRNFFAYQGLIVQSLFMAIEALLLTWWVYLMVIDIVYNKKGFLYNSYTNKLISKYSGYEKNFHFQKAMLTRTYVFLATEAILIFLTIMIFVIASKIITTGYSLLISTFILVPGIYLAYWYIKRLAGIIRDVDSMIDHMKTIRDGNLTEKLSLAPDADLYEMSELLNGIQDGMDKAVQKMIKSERMKIELVTNVSHDLKTPLTSIISYVDLLSKEEGLPNGAVEYVKVLLQKSEQLKKLIQDLFDLSKATSGEMKVENERLEFGKLTRQTLADMHDEMAGSQLTFRINLPEEPVYIFSDGKRLYRVLMNLLDNVLKYSMKGTRVYIDLSVICNKAVLEIKNISNYEMNFSAEEILERFVRGDKARSTEGSGLGLAIADSFVKLCGGALEIKLDGDLFKAIVTLPTVADGENTILPKPRSTSSQQKNVPVL